MRLLLDLQCVQSTSAVRGIGRYALSLSRALVEKAGPEDRVEVLLNAGDEPARLLRARTALEMFLPARAVHVFDAPWPWQHHPSPARRAEAEAVRSAAIASLAPDALLVGSIFEGDKENLLSVDRYGVPTAALLYDLIPASDPHTYLLGPGADSYWRRYEELRRVDLLLAISNYSAQQARNLLGDSCPRAVPIWGGPYPSGLFTAFETRAASAPLDVPDRYLLSVGGDHPRKNLDRLVQAWAAVADRAQTALVIACRLNVGTARRLRRLAKRGWLQPGELILAGEVSEKALDALYRGALAFIFPSTEEGLGMPPLEAMAAGCPTVLARGSSLSELVDEDDAYFDGFDVADIARSITRVLHDNAFRHRLRKVAAACTSRFTWTRAAELAWAALHELPRRPVSPPDVSPPGSVADLPRDPRPLVLTEVPAVPDGPEAVAAERTLGLCSDVPGLVTALAPAPALVVPDDALARRLVTAGLVEQPVLSVEDQLRRATAHDLYAAVRDRLPTPRWPDDLVHALAHPPRWSLERAWPVWLWLTARERTAPPAVPEGVVLVIARAPAVVLARSVDRVVVDAELLPKLQADLHRARCLGAAVTVLGDVAPDWASPPDPVAVRTTGWPWSV